MDMDFAIHRPLVRSQAASYPISVRRVAVLLSLPSDATSRGRPCESLALHLHQVVQGTFTPKLSNMLSTRWPRSFLDLGEPIYELPGISTSQAPPVETVTTNDPENKQRMFEYQGLRPFSNRLPQDRRSWATRLPTCSSYLSMQRAAPAGSTSPAVADSRSSRNCFRHNPPPYPRSFPSLWTTR